MRMKAYPRSDVYQLIEPGPVVLRDDRAAFGLTPVPAARAGAPLVAECFANLECKVYDLRFSCRYNLFVLRVIKAWIDPAQKHPKTIHHKGYGRFVVDGATIHLNSAMR
jgi:flavin reductase (DIM6/NTAB) family NADH-FMN oxidoreductase RutF